MAVSLTLNWVLNETVYDDSLNLLGYTDGFDLAENGWVPKVPVDGSKTLVEVLTLRVQAASADGLATVLQRLDDYKQRVTWSRDNTEFNAVWLTAQMNNETMPRRALVVRLEYQLEQGFYDTIVSTTSRLPTLILTLERSPFWEAPYDGGSMPADPIDNVDVSGSKVELVDLIAGDVPARLSWFRIYAAANTAFEPRINKVWLGWRTTRFGVPANFAETWSLSLGGFPGTDTGVVADADTFNGDKIECTFGDGEDYAMRVYINLADVTANLNDQRGRFLVLLRARVNTDGLPDTVVRAGLAYGFNNPLPQLYLESETQFSKKLLTTGYNSWRWHEMGVISIPPTKRLLRNYGVDSLSNFGMAIYAERLAGVENLQMDCLRLIPVNDGYVKVDCGPNDVVSGSDAESIVISTDPLGEVTGYAVDDFDQATAIVLYNAGTEAVNWAAPNNRTDLPYLVVAHEAASGGIISLDMSVEYLVYPRWRTLRGGDANSYA